jgi:Fic family protein
LNLVLIHPYSDGNGRMARALQTIVSARAGEALDPVFISIEEYLGRKTLAYYDVLAKVGQGEWQPTHNTRPWIRFCLKAHYRQLKTLKQRNDRLGVLCDEIESVVKTKGLPERSIPSLANAALSLRIRNPYYRNAADVSPAVAGWDLKALVDAGVLIAEGEKRERFYIAAPKLREIAAEAPKPAKVEDPFEGHERADETQPTLPGPV